MADQSDIIADLARAWAEFLRPALSYAMRNATCRHCGAPIQPGIAMGQTYAIGAPDLGGGDGQTMSPGGPGVVIPVSKCTACGWSVTGNEGPL